VILHRRDYIAAFCFFLFIFWGCSVTEKAMPQMDFSSPEEVLEYVSATIPADVTLQTLANIQVTNRDGRYPMKLAILLKKPTWLRVEAIPVLGPPTFFLSIHGQTLKVFLAEARAFYISRATTENIARYLPLSMDPEDMLAILMGTCPALNDQGRIVTGRREGKHYRIDMEGAMKRLSFRVRMTDGFLERLDVYQGQNAVYHVSFDDPLVLDGSVIPQKINIVSNDKGETSISIRYADIQLLRTSDPAIFDLQVPPGIIPLYLD